MGKGGLNRLLLTAADLTTPNLATLQACDPRAIHIRTILSPSALTSSSPSHSLLPPPSPPPLPLPLRVAVEHLYLHDAALATIHPSATVSIQLPVDGRRPASDAPPVVLVVAMQRPKVMARILSTAASLGVQGILVTAADKVEKSYWDCKLFRTHSPPLTPAHAVIATVTTTATAASTTHDALPGRPRGDGHHPERDDEEEVGHNAACDARAVDALPAVRRRLLEGVEQASADAMMPWVVLHRRGLRSVVQDNKWGLGKGGGRERWTRLVAHPGGTGQGVVSRVRQSGEGEGVVVAIGPEGGWTEAEVELLEGEGFARVGMGTRVLRSETAVVVALGLVHEGLRERSRRPGGGEGRGCG